MWEFLKAEIINPMTIEFSKKGFSEGSRSGDHTSEVHLARNIINQLIMNQIQFFP